MTVDFQTPL